MNRLIRAICIGGLIAAPGGCAEPGNRSCAPELGPPILVFTLFLGNAIPGRGDLTDKEWQAFLDDTITTNLPNGYTVLDAHGAWMNPMTRKTIKEATKIVVAALPDVPDSVASVNRVRTGYQLRFHQQLVGMVVEHACGVF